MDDIVVMCSCLYDDVSETVILRQDLEDVKVRGKGCPKPIKTWAQCGANKKVLDALKKYHFLLIVFKQLTKFLPLT